jgi:hypothetical protein
LVAVQANVANDDAAVRDLAMARAEVSTPRSSLQGKPDPPGHVLRTSRGSASRRGPSTGLKFVPSTDSDYRRTERLRFEVTSDDVSAASARLLGPAGTPVNVPVSVIIRFDEPTKQSTVVAELTLAALAPAEYELELTLDERGDKNIVNYRFGIVR